MNSGVAEALARHVAADEEEAADIQRILDFVARHADPFDRRIREGHLTGSAIVVSSAGDRVLLLHHRKLGRWLQSGGHADHGETAGEEVALREAGEETGIVGLVLHPTAPRPLDVDVHDIPARRDEPAHQHLDLRYLVLAPEGVTARPPRAESREIRWVRWEEVEGLGPDHGLRRALTKARRILGAVVPSGAVADSRIELHPTTCSCRGGSWAILGDKARSACSGPRGEQVETVTLRFADWKSLGKPPNLDEYRKAAARAEGGERREFTRFDAIVRVRLCRIPSWRNEVAQSEETETEVVAQGGALVRSRMAVETGEVLSFEVGGFRTRAEVRYVSGGSAGEEFQRLGLRFLDALLPENLIPAERKPA